VYKLFSKMVIGKISVLAFNEGLITKYRVTDIAIKKIVMAEIFNLFFHKLIITSSQSIPSLSIGFFIIKINL
jgi:hypothetical protein